MDLSERMKKIKEKEEPKEIEIDVEVSKEVPIKKTTKPKTKKTEKRDFDYSEYPVIVLLWGHDGTSKSEQILKFEPKESTLIFDLEDKLRPLAAKIGFPQENIINAKKYNDAFDVDGPETLQGIRNILDEIKESKLNKKGKFAHITAIAFDGISDIRKPYAILEWLSENPDRVRPMNWGDWGDINDKVRDICFKMINMGLQTNTHIFFTAQIDFKGEGEEVPNCKPWIWHNIQHKFKMIRDDINHRFYAYCEKSHFDPFFTIDVTDWTHEEKPSLLNMLQDPELLKKYKEESNQVQVEIVKKKAGDIF